MFSSFKSSISKYRNIQRNLKYFIDIWKRFLNLIICCFQADKPFSRGAPFLKDDIELLIDFFLANFRINPHNNDTLKVSSNEFEERCCKSKLNLLLSTMYISKRKLQKLVLFWKCHFFIYFTEQLTETIQSTIQRKNYIVSQLEASFRKPTSNLFG